MHYNRVMLLFCTWILYLLNTLTCAATIPGPLGGSVTLPCDLDGTHKYVDWERYDAAWLQIVRQYENQDPVEIDPYKGRTQLEYDTGDVVISGLTMDDERQFRCHYNDIASAIGKTKKVEHQLSIYVSPETITPSGLDNSWVDRDLEYTLTCTVARIKPEGTIFWEIDSSQKGAAGDTKSESNGDGTFSLSMEYKHRFNDGSSRSDVRCLVKMDVGGETMETKVPYKNVTVYWKPSTRVLNATTDRPPTEGTAYTLTCDVTDAKPTAISSFKWKWGSGGSQETTSPDLVIDSLDRTDHTAVFSCAAVNTPGEGEYSSGGDSLSITVWYLPTVSVTPSPEAIEGTSVTISCQNTDSFPHELGEVRWRKDGQPLTIDGVHITGGTVSDPSISINDVERGDRGTYTCVLVNGAGEGQADATLDVLYKPDPPTLTTSLGRTTIAVNESVTFTCSNDMDSNPDPTHFTFYKGGNSEVNDTSTSWGPRTLDRVRKDSGQYSCAASNKVGAGERSEVLDVQVQAVATIEKFQESITANPVYNGSFFLDCVGAGHERMVSWTKEGGSLPEGHFREEGSGKVEDESISYDQGEGLRRRYVWISPAATCGQVDKHDGQYTCTVTATAGGQHTTARDQATVQVQYPPITRSGLIYHEAAAKVKETHVFSCDVCSNPAVDSYRWIYNKTEIGTGQDVTIADIDEDDYGNYTCIVCNIINGNQWCQEYIYDLKPKGPPKAPTGLQSSNETSQTVSLTFTPDFNGGSEQTFRLEYNNEDDPDSDYVLYQDGIADPNKEAYRARIPITVRVVELDPATRYSFRVRGENQEEEDNESEWTYGRNIQTLEPPIVRVTSEIVYDYTEHTVAFSWEVIQGKPTELELVQRPKQSTRSVYADTDWVVMVPGLDPNDGLYDGGVEEGSGLERSRSYEMGLRAVEQDVVTNPGADYIVPKDGEPGSLSGGAVAGIVIGCLLLVAVPLLVVGFLMRQRQMKDARSDTNLALSRENDNTENSNNGFSREFENNAVQTQAAPEHKTVVETSMEETPYAAVNKPKPTDRSKMPMPAIPDQTTQKPKWEYEDPPSDLEEIPEEEENPYGSAPPVPDRYYAGDFYANVDENGEKLYDPDYRCPPGEESDYWEFAGEMRKPGEKPVRISYFKETIYQRFYWYEWPMSEAELENYG